MKIHFEKSIKSTYILLVKVLFIYLYVGISPQRKAQILELSFMEELFLSIEDLWVGLRSLSGGEGLMCLQTLANFLRLRCATFLVKTLWSILFSSAILSRLPAGSHSQAVALLWVFSYSASRLCPFIPQNGSSREMSPSSPSSNAVVFHQS